MFVPNRHALSLTRSRTRLRVSANTHYVRLPSTGPAQEDGQANKRVCWRPLTLFKLSQIPHTTTPTATRRQATPQKPPALVVVGFDAPILSQNSTRCGVIGAQGSHKSPRKQQQKNSGQRAQKNKSFGPGDVKSLDEASFAENFIRNTTPHRFTLLDVIRSRCHRHASATRRGGFNENTGTAVWSFRRF